MITLTVHDNKSKKDLVEVYSSLDKALNRLEVVGPKPKRGEVISPKKRYILIGGSWDTKSEEGMLKPYLYPDKESEE